MLCFYEPQTGKTMHTSLLCFSHLRWNFVYQRPQHLMSRFSKIYRVYFIEEPVYDAISRYNEITVDASCGVMVVVPHIEPSAINKIAEQKALLDLLLEEHHIDKYISWYYAPLQLSFTYHLIPEITVYDCMDELAAFRFADPAIKRMEKLLMLKADIVFTGGQSLYKAKINMHANIYAMPSSIDKEHFYQARTIQNDPTDQEAIPHPRIGFYGVVDERFNFNLVTSLAIQHPEWHFIIIGPTAKIDDRDLPTVDNIHFLGPKEYKELPAYLAGWDIAMMPFALNEATKYISPTKTPEYLAAGKPVISTSITDVVNTYGKQGLVEIADTVPEFEEAIEKLLAITNKNSWLEKVDNYLADISWDKTWSAMFGLMGKAGANKISIEKKTHQQAYV
jgi:UDP-galactopyranose mutase